MRTCPRCGSNHVHRSRMHSFPQRAFRALTGMRRYRCHACGWRGWRSSASYSRRNRGGRKQTLRWLAMAAVVIAAGLCTGLVAIYLSGNQAE